MSRARSAIKLLNRQCGEPRNLTFVNNFLRLSSEGKSFLFPVTFSVALKNVSPLGRLIGALKGSRVAITKGSIQDRVSTILGVTPILRSRWFFDQLTLISSNHFHCATDGRRRAKKPLHPLEMRRLKMVDTSRRKEGQVAERAAQKATVR